MPSPFKQTATAIGQLSVASFFRKCHLLSGLSTIDDVRVLCLRSPIIVKKKDEIALAYPTQMIDRVLSKSRRC